MLSAECLQRTASLVDHGQRFFPVQFDSQRVSQWLDRLDEIRRVQHDGRRPASGGLQAFNQALSSSLRHGLGTISEMKSQEDGRLRPESGTVRVFGFEPVTDPVAVLGRIGYLSENRDLPPWMRVDELLRYTSAFYPKWDAAYAEELRQQFGLEHDSKINTLSRGEMAKAGLLIALAYRPELLLLNEPSSGLDPVVR